MKCIICYNWTANGEAQDELQKEVDLPFVPPIGMDYWPTGTGEIFTASKVEALDWFEDEQVLYVGLSVVDFGQCDAEDQRRFMIANGWFTP